ncbi:40S ribosomal protein S5-1 [Monoraphidium neglectum]|uniref:40S ribosomal protein S5-1 n=1 Tax=Monoraphidium neglectum TaxID=145388 RepID=A0A0D2MUX8_9CHLO|nr:40S ribosomal protein S5-1 [Monoraphidium neglectum]KIZ06350.1 40S ribosomal protein S5-1 [Monoraphidium neglectum]|eukprot:XP_013905369.1 40S ribosomal protein S5-1 [Monoraphidium neglectum]
MATQGSDAVEVKLFGKWSFEEVEVTDISLEDYIAVKPKFAVYVPHTAGRYQKRRFRKALCPIVERLTNSIMMHGRNNGKKLMARGSMADPDLIGSDDARWSLPQTLKETAETAWPGRAAVRIVSHAFDIIHLLSDQNPIQVLVDAIINSGPREDATRIGSAGVVRRQAVDISPLRRVNSAIWLLTTGAREAAFRNVKTIAECLADELINAAKGSSNSYAIKKKDELERVAKANR